MNGSVTSGRTSKSTVLVQTLLHVVTLRSGLYGYFRTK